MVKLKLFSMMLLTAFMILAGCQTSSSVSSAATDGDGFTCNEVYRAFDAYEQDKQSASAWSQLSQMISPASTSYARMGAETAARYFDRIKAATNLSLAIRGCQPVR